MTASDLETTMSAKMEVRTEDTGALAVPARMLLDILKAFLTFHSPSRWIRRRMPLS